MANKMANKGAGCQIEECNGTGSIYLTEVADGEGEALLPGRPSDAVAW
jgi:hypothetical protein